MKIRKPLTPEQLERKNTYQRKWCRKNPDKRRANSLRNYEKHKDSILAAARDYSRRHGHRQHLKTYGITPDEYRRLLVEQDGHCALCPNTSSGRRRLSVDHDHKTQAVRGLLCSKCNSAVGLLKDDPSRFRLAAEYLERANQC